MAEERTEYDLVYVDGSHLFEDVFVDAYFATRLLARDGVIAFADSADPHVAKVLRFLRASARGALEEIDVGVYRERHRPFIYGASRLLGRVQLTAFRRIGTIARPWNARFQRF